MLLCRVLCAVVVCICMCSVTLSNDLGPAPFPYGASVQLAPLSNQHCSIKAVETRCAASVGWLWQCCKVLMRVRKCVTLSGCCFLAPLFTPLDIRMCGFFCFVFLDFLGLAFLKLCKKKKKKKIFFFLKKFCFIWKVFGLTLFSFGFFEFEKTQQNNKSSSSFKH